jgi:hypothetical protein
MTNKQNTSDICSIKRHMELVFCTKIKSKVIQGFGSRDNLFKDFAAHRKTIKLHFLKWMMMKFRIKKYTSVWLIINASRI